MEYNSLIHLGYSLVELEYWKGVWGSSERSVSNVEVLSGEGWFGGAPEMSTFIQGCSGGGLEMISICDLLGIYFYYLCKIYSHHYGFNTLR